MYVSIYLLLSGLRSKYLFFTLCVLCNTIFFSELLVFLRLWKLTTRRQCVKLDPANSNLVEVNSLLFYLKIKLFFPQGFEIAGFICTWLGAFFSFCSWEILAGFTQPFYYPILIFNDFESSKILIILTSSKNCKKCSCLDLVSMYNVHLFEV